MATTTTLRGSCSYLERQQHRSPRSILGQMLTVRQAAACLGITPKALQQRIQNGIAPTHHRLGNRILFKEADVLAYKEARS